VQDALAFQGSGEIVDLLDQRLSRQMSVVGYRLTADADRL
jgi:hypothetical protein